MEFFRIVNVNTNEDQIQKFLRLTDLEALSTQLFVLENKSDREAMIGGVWGEFLLSREIIKGGLRFALTDCPNALAWTITTGYPPARRSIVIHLTINRERKHPDFMEEVEEFLDDQIACLEKTFS